MMMDADYDSDYDLYELLEEIALARLRDLDALSDEETEMDSDDDDFV